MIFSWTTNWDGIVMMEETLFPNEWTMRIEFDSLVDNPQQEFVAMARLQHLVEAQFHDAIFANVEDEWVGKMYEGRKCKIITLPEDPMEVTIAIAALSKMICVTEGRFDFAGVRISSKLADGLECNFDAADLAAFDWLRDNPIQKVTGEPAWFMRPDAGATDIMLKKKKKLEIIRDVDKWENYNLSWESLPDAPLAQSGAPVRPAPPLIKGWKPKVIDGGKGE